jgi:phosphate transport system substrate-binding protein
LLWAEPAKADSRREAHVVGSSTLYAFTAVVAEAFAGTTDNPAPVIEATGTGGGFKLFCAGVGLNTPDIVTASRPMTADEKALCAANGVGEIARHMIGHGGVVVVQARQAGARGGGNVNPTRRQLWLALAKTVPVDGVLVANPYTRWSQIDPALPDRPIRVYGPPPTSGTRDIFAEAIMEGGCSAFRNVQNLAAADRREICEHFREDGVFVEAGENDDLAVRRIADDGQSMGIVGYNALRRHAHLVAGIPLEGVMPDVKTIASGSYPVSRELSLYVKTAHLQSVPSLAAFVREMTGKAAIGEDGYLVEIGLIPLGTGVSPAP